MLELVFSCLGWHHPLTRSVALTIGWQRVFWSVQTTESRWGAQYLCQSKRLCASQCFSSYNWPVFFFFLVLLQAVFLSHRCSASLINLWTCDWLAGFIFGVSPVSREQHVALWLFNLTWWPSWQTNLSCSLIFCSIRVKFVTSSAIKSVLK